MTLLEAALTIDVVEGGWLVRDEDDQKEPFIWTQFSRFYDQSGNLWSPWLGELESEFWVPVECSMPSPFAPQEEVSPQ